jgi:hypothetical protein
MMSRSPRSWQLHLRPCCAGSRVRAAALLAVATVVLAGCSSVGDHLPTAAGGLPEGAPARPTNPAAYPAVHDVPPPRPQSVLTDAEQQKLEDDLIAARNRAAGAARAR